MLVDGVATSYPRREGERGFIQIFLLAVPIGASFSSVTMQTSSIRRICSSSWPDSASLVVSMSGKRRSMASAVIGCARVVVVDMAVNWEVGWVLMVVFLYRTPRN